MNKIFNLALNNMIFFSYHWTDLFKIYIIIHNFVFIFYYSIIIQFYGRNQLIKQWDKKARYANANN